MVIEVRERQFRERPVESVDQALREIHPGVESTVEVCYVRGIVDAAGAFAVPRKREAGGDGDQRSVESVRKPDERVVGKRFDQNRVEANVQVHQLPRRSRVQNSYAGFDVFKHEPQVVKQGETMVRAQLSGREL